MSSERASFSGIAIDLGATSGRVMLGTVASDRLEIRELNRFQNVAVAPDGTLRWDVLGIWQHILDGLAAAARSGLDISSIGVDAWGVDYALLRKGRLLANPTHYRDVHHIDGVDAVHEKMPHADQYARSGTQYLEINTIYQLEADRDMVALADTALLIPGLFTHWLGGDLVTERTIASTTGLLGLDGQWDPALLAACSVPTSLLPPIVAAGKRVGALHDSIALQAGFAAPPHIVAVAAHDTASAVLAAPLTSSASAFVSCGTWGLVGIETPYPITSQAAREAAFTNEAGANGGYLLHHNTMGLGLLNEAHRQWAREGRPFPLDELLDAAARVTTPTPVVDLDDPVLAGNEPIEIRLQRWCATHGAAAPEGVVEIVRCIVESLAATFADAVATVGEIAARRIEEIHVVGGGSLNSLLCGLLAQYAGIRVLAGPAEASTIGNLLIQARSAGVVGDSAEDMRRLVRHAYPPTIYLPTSLGTTHLPQGAL